MAVNKINPFPTTGYIGKEYFCDRETELTTLKNLVENGVNTTLISPRRLGKSALIHRLFEELETAKSFYCIYTDIYATQSIKDFTECLSQMILRQIPEQKSIGNRFLDLLKAFHPVISYDPLSGQPEISLEFTENKAVEKTLASIFHFLDSQNKPILIAIDEFQQIANYPETNTESILRSHIQRLKNVHFIFSGSNKHMMVELFNSAKRPFFSSTRMLSLPVIDQDIYSSFIRDKFGDSDREIQPEAVQFILDWTRSHTYYTQTICNLVYASPLKKIKEEDVKNICDSFLGSQQAMYIQYRRLLSPVQWQLLIAIAKEGSVSQPQSKYFLEKYNIGTPSNSKRALDALLTKEMIYQEDDLKSSRYQVYDVFLSRWLERTF